ncbi:MAG: leucine-rich repeat domain-containing protein [Muribaculaceae bacterium]|nr:leucine-rich repeat domain-containing protein [Muribaculaceae bacterium]
MKKLILLLLGTFISFSALAQTFTYEYEGQTLKYTILSETDKTCEVAKQWLWFDGDLHIPDVAVYESTEYAVTSIEEFAFYGFYRFSTVNIPASVTTIGDAAFASCTNMTAFNVDANNKNYRSIDGVLYDRDITELIQCPAGLPGNFNIPNSVISIGYCAFAGCLNLVSVVIPNSVTSIGDFAFLACSGLTSIEIPESVTSLGKRAFSKCSNLRSVDIMAQVRIIDDETFSECSSLASIVIPNSVTSIGSRTFNECKNLTTVELPDLVTDIGNGAFFACSSLSTIEIPSSVTTIGEAVFYLCEGLTSVLLPNALTSIGNSAFGDCTRLSSINIPATVTSIGNYAFSGCSSLTSVDIPAYVNSIGICAFGFCRNLTSINVDINNQNYSSIDGVLFDSEVTTLIQYPAGLIGEYEIPSSVNLIVEDAFYGSGSLTSVSIPGCVTAIGEMAFYFCERLEAVYYATDDPKEFPRNIFDSQTYSRANLYVPEGALEKCKQIDPWKNFIFFNGTFNYDFYGSRLTFKITDEVNKTCSVIDCQPSDETYIYVPAFAVKGSQEYEVTSIGDDAFAGLTMKFFSIPTSVTSIGNRAFCNCDELLDIQIPESVTSVGEEAFENCSRLYAVAFGKAIVSIGDRAFKNCGDLNFYYLPANNLNSIGNEAFSGCSSLESVFIPGSVISIGDEAFAECKNLTTVVYDSEDPLEFNYNIFDYATYTSATLYVPETAVEKCKQIDPWKNFKNIQQFDGVDDITVDVDMTAPCEVYTISGVKVADSTEGLATGLYIVRQGSVVKKIRIN